MDTTTENLVKIDDALDYLNEEYPSLYTNVLNLGSPRLTGEIETAGVGINPADGSKLEFLLGEKMMSSLDHEEVASVLVHESMHVTLNHVWAYDSVADQDSLNKAMDAVINDFMLKNEFKMPDGQFKGFSGIEQLGVDCSDMSIGQVLEIIEQQASEQPEDGDDDSDESGDGSGNSGGSGGFDSHEWMNKNQDQKQQIQDIVDGKAESGDVENPEGMESENPEDYDDDTHVDRGLGEGSEREILSAGIGAQWVELLREVDPDIIPEPSYLKQNVASWNHINRKVVHMYPSVLLPTYENTHDREGYGNEKAKIVLCLDTSGSVQHTDVAAFLALARSIPQDKVDVDLYGFHGKAYKIDINKPRIYSGGTCFKKCFDQICIDYKVGNDNWGNFPNAVIVITDMQDYYSDRNGSASYEGNYGMHMARHIREQDLQDNFLVMHNYKNAPGGYRASYMNEAKSVFGEDRVRSMYDFVDSNALKTLASSTKYARGGSIW